MDFAMPFYDYITETQATQGEEIKLRKKKRWAEVRTPALFLGLKISIRSRICKRVIF